MATVSTVSGRLRFSLLLFILLSDVSAGLGLFCRLSSLIKFSNTRLFYPVWPKRRRSLLTKNSLDRNQLAINLVTHVLRVLQRTMVPLVALILVQAVKPPPAVPSPRCIETEASTSSLSISWSSNPAAFSQYYVEIAHMAGDRPFALQTSSGNALVFKGLMPNTNYSISLRALPVAAPSESWGPAWKTGSDVISCRTASASIDTHHVPIITPSSGNKTTTSFMRVYRISEYSFDVDFLRNHDTASVDAMPLYLMTCDPHGTCSPWDAKVLE